MLRMAVILASCVVCTVSASDTVDIADPDQVTALTEIQTAIETIGTSVTACMGSGKEHETCLCESEEQILEFNDSVNKLFVAYPAFDGLDVVRFKLSDGTWISHSLTSIKAQSSMALTCPP